MIKVIVDSKDVTNYLKTLGIRTNRNVSKVMSKLARDVQITAKRNVEIAMVDSPGSTGALVANIRGKRVTAKKETSSWQIFVSGPSAKYAAEIESKEGIQGGVTRSVKGSLRNWVSRIEGSGTYVPIRTGNVIHVGRGLSSKSLWSNPQFINGVRYMERALDEHTRNLDEKIDAAVDAAIKK